MTETWDDYARTSEDVPDDWRAYLAPGLNTPRAPQEMRAAPDDKYRAAAMADRERMLKPGGLWNAPPDEGYNERLMRGAGIGWADELGAVVGTPPQLLRGRGADAPQSLNAIDQVIGRPVTSPIINRVIDAYRYAKAREDLTSQATRENTKGVMGAAAELAGGLATGATVLGGGVRSGAARIPFTKAAEVPASVVNWGANVGKGAGWGGFAGAGEAKDIEGIPKGLMVGGVMGGVLGGALPIAASALGHTARTLQMPRLRDPEKIATERVASTMREAGVTPQQVLAEVEAAHIAGQPYTVADAMGVAGERALTGLRKTPGAQRDVISDVLTTRNLDKPVRVGAEISRDFGVEGTARQATRGLNEQAAATAAPIYREAEQVPTWSPRLQEFLKEPDVQKALAKGVRMQRREAIGRGEPVEAYDRVVTDFNAALENISSDVPNVKSLQTVKVGLDRMIEANTDAVTGKVNAEGRSLDIFRRGLLAEMDRLNPKFAEARAAYAGPMEVADAVTTGREMATRGRSADTIPQFFGMTGPEQQGVRIGYADKVLEPFERSGNLPDLLRQKSLKGREELDALSRREGPYRPGDETPLRKYLNREEKMQSTSNAALGGSSTVENAADVAAQQGVDVPAIVSSLGSGNPTGILQSVLPRLGAITRGESEAQRMAITRALLEGDPNKVREMAQRIEEHELRRRGVNPWTGQYRYRQGE